MRAFFGTLLSHPLQAHFQRLTNGLDGEHPRHLRPIPDDTAHITYAFLPQLADERQDDALTAMREVASRHRAIDVEYGPPHLLWGGRSPRLICVDVTAAVDRVRALADDITRTLVSRIPGLDVGPMKSAHVTLARFRRDATRSDGRAIEAMLRDPRFSAATTRDRIDSVALLASALTQRGPVYRTVQRCELRP